MPLVRKPGKSSAPSTPGTQDVLASLSSPDEDKRWSAARAAADIDGGAAALIAALRTEPSERVREAMFTSLARIGTPECVAGVLPLLRSDDANLRTGALDALRVMTSSVRDLLPPLLHDSDVDVRILSCELARSLPGEDATHMLCELLANERDVNVCAAAIDVLAEVGNARALPVLAACAHRFPDTPFLAFAIQIATDRIHAQSTLTSE